MTTRPFLWTVPINHKHEVGDIIKQFVRSIKTQHSKTIKTIRSDKGGEYINTSLKTYFERKGILYQVSAAYTPQQNSRAERINLTLLNSIRTILAESKTPKIYWAEALNCVTYTKNRSPSKPNNFKTPYEVLYHKLPNFNKLKPFGCISFALHKPKKGKLESKSKELMFVGYSEKSKAYRLLNPAENTILETDSVTFNEEEYFFINKLDKEKEEFNRRQQNSIEYKENLHDDTNETKSESEYSWEDSESPKSSDDSDRFTSEELETSESESESSDSDHRPPPEIDKNKNWKDKIPRYFTRSGRESKPPQRYGHKVLSVTEPQTITDAQTSEDWNNWKQAIEKELSQMEKNNVWEICETPSTNTKIISSRWIFKKKIDTEGKCIHRARLVAKGFQQIYGHNYYETYAPVTCLDTIRLTLAEAAANNNYIHQLDITTAFLNSDIDEDVYMYFPEGMQKKPNKVLKLNKSL